MSSSTLPSHGADTAPFAIEDPKHRQELREDAERQLAFFRKALRPEGGFFQLGTDGTAHGSLQELFSTTRMVHSFALAKKLGFADCDSIIDHGMNALQTLHWDPVHGGYLSAVDGSGVVKDPTKMAYGHAFVLLAASSAKMVQHPDADAMLRTITQIMFDRFWDEQSGLFLDEANRDWTPFSSYRGFNANMHSCEALLAAYEATGDQTYLEKAGRILDFFAFKIANAHSHRIPEHYTTDWQVDPNYEGNLMFRPAGTTPGHSFELARLALDYGASSGNANARYRKQARALVERALDDAWDAEKGGFVYTLKLGGSVDKPSRYWWPATEALGVLSALIKRERNREDDAWYRKIWAFASHTFIDHEYGGWFPEIDESGRPTDLQFKGKPDIYHSLQATLFPLVDE